MNIAAGESYKPGGVTEGNQLSITDGKIGMGENEKYNILVDIIIGIMPTSLQPRHRIIISAWKMVQSIPTVAPYP